MKSAMNEELVACFTASGFEIEYAPLKDKIISERKVSLETDLIKIYTQSHDEMLFHLAFVSETAEFSASLAFLARLCSNFIHDLSRTVDVEVTREKTVVELSDQGLAELLEHVPFAVGYEHVSPQWIQRIYGRLNRVYGRRIEKFSGTVEGFLEQYDTRINVVGRVFFHLVENKIPEYPFAFLATYSPTRLGDSRDKGSKGEAISRQEHKPLKDALLEFKGQQEALLKLLSTVNRVSQNSAFIAELVESGELFSPLKFTAAEAYRFLTEIPLYESCGILCRMPDWWKKQNRQFKIAVQVGDKEPAQVGLDALLAFDARLMLGDEEISEAEVRSILSQASGLSLIKGKWVAVDHEKLAATLAAYDKANALAKGAGYTFAEAMRLQLSAAQRFSKNHPEVVVEISHGEWLKALRGRLAGDVFDEGAVLSPDFNAVLRAYQARGFRWLKTMMAMGFGACLADDMGLGKTLQVLALISHLSVAEPDSSCLLILPASLMGNWQREIEKFFPSLKYQMIYSAKDEPDLQGETLLYLTTYGMINRMESLKAKEWDLIILDEAQAIKNAGTKQSRSVKALRSKGRIALTGTPIENSLNDLWSLFDFLNPGLLGTAKEFASIIKGLREGRIEYSKMREVVSPFILRRLKTDKTVIDSLPEKLEMKAYTTLSKKQIVLYNALVKSLESELHQVEGIGRKGLVLASLMKFKQICNHPDQYLGQGSYQHEHSGKFERLTEICETIYQKRERVLIFTQFREMTQPISDFLESIFKRKGLILHGGTPVKKRGDLVEQFCGEEYMPYMVLSLKAGGVGLNLTAANHVIHFDRWWNPAVENQATDRAFRIGQEKDVMVHKFITMGTIEEKIDQMIESKSRLSEELISSAGETWITELSNDQLIDLFRLS